MSMMSAVSHVWRDAREVVLEQFEYRELLVQMIRRDLLIRYKQAVMGFAWAVFMPLMNTAIFSVIFMRVAPLHIDVPYPLFAYLGLLTWNFTASSLRFAVGSLTSNITLVTKVYLPREIFPLTAVLVTVVDTLVGAVVLVGLLVYYRVPPGLAWGYLPLVAAVHITLTLAIGLLLAMANLFFRDVKYLFEVVITVWMFASSVLYPSELVTGKLGVVFRLNPMTAIIDGYRSVLLYNRSPMSPVFTSAMIVTAILLCCVAIGFHRAEYRFAEAA
jgi:lipopolysaccharide transport system permease protein